MSANIHVCTSTQIKFLICILYMQWVFSPQIVPVSRVTLHINQHILVNFALNINAVYVNMQR